MDKFKHLLIGLAALAISSNASAIILKDGSEIMEFSDYGTDFIEDVIGGEYDVADWIRNKLDRKYTRLGVKNDKLATAELRDYQVKRLTRKIDKKEIKIAKFLSRVGLDETLSEINSDGEGGGSESVPEPSIIALLGLGLVGVGVARRLRRKSA